MRQQLVRPVRDTARLNRVATPVREIYRLQESGVDYAPELSTLAAAVGKNGTKSEVQLAFGASAPESLAADLLLAREAIPLDLTEEEMLELIERICSANGTAFQLSYWITCLAANTGDDRISDLICWPDSYFGDGARAHELSPRQILDTALTAGRKRRT